MSRWTPIAGLLGIGIGVALAALIAFKPVSRSSPLGTGDCGDTAWSFVTNGEGASVKTKVDGVEKTAPTDCYRAAERDLLLAGAVLVLPFVAVIGYSLAARSRGSDDWLNDPRRPPRRRRF